MSSGPQHGIIGDQFATDLPETTQDKKGLSEEQQMARYSKSAEFMKLKEYLETRIEFYQKYLPDGRPSEEIAPSELGENWLVANSVIREIKAIISNYENAREAVEKKLGKN